MKTRDFPPHGNPERFSPTPLALAIAAHPAHTQSKGKSQTNPPTKNPTMILILAK
jgi:hypothetical protein